MGGGKNGRAKNRWTANKIEDNGESVCGGGVESYELIKTGGNVHLQ